MTSCRIAQHTWPGNTVKQASFTTLKQNPLPRIRQRTLQVAPHVIAAVVWTGYHHIVVRERTWRRVARVDHCDVWGCQENSLHSANNTILQCYLKVVVDLHSFSMKSLRACFMSGAMIVKWHVAVSLMPRPLSGTVCLLISVQQKLLNVSELHFVRIFTFLLLVPFPAETSSRACDSRVFTWQLGASPNAFNNNDNNNSDNNRPTLGRRWNLCDDGTTISVHHYSRNRSRTWRLYTHPLFRTQLLAIFYYNTEQTGKIKLK